MFWGTLLILYISYVVSSFNIEVVRHTLVYYYLPSKSLYFLDFKTIFHLFQLGIMSEFTYSFFFSDVCIRKILFFYFLIPFSPTNSDYFFQSQWYFLESFPKFIQFLEGIHTSDICFIS